MKKMQQELQLTMPVRVSYEFLPEMLIDGQLLPEQIDITEVIVEIPDSKGKLRRVNLLNALDISTVLLLEDEIIDGL